MDNRHRLLRALAWLYGLLRRFIVESFALAEEDEYEYESEDDFPTDEEVAGITIMMMEENF